MAVRIGHARSDENKNITGGQLGDQTGGEVCITPYYNGGWDTVLRPKKDSVAEKSAKACEAACANKNIGYGQEIKINDGRNTLYAEAVKVNHDLAKIKTPCECDCSSFMQECAIAGGANITYGSNGLTTRTMVDAFVKSGDYEKLTDSKYLTSDKYLLRSDILVKQGSHTVMVLDDGSAAKEERMDYSKSYAKTYITTTDLNLREGANANTLVVVIIPGGKEVVCDGYYVMNGSTPWLHVKYDGHEGFCSSKYLTAKPTTPTAVKKSYKWNGVDYALVFDPIYYANKYSDLKKAFGTNEDKLFNHFTTYGMKESRQAIATFNVVTYKNTYADLRKAFGTNMPAYYKHYIQYGNKEGRKAV